MSIGPHGGIGCEVSSCDWPGLQSSCLGRRRVFSAISSRLLSETMGKGRKIKKWIPKQMTGYLFQTHLIQQLSKPAELSFQLAIVFFQYFHSSL